MKVAADGVVGCMQACVNDQCSAPESVCGSGPAAVACQTGEQCDPVTSTCCQTGAVLPAGEAEVVAATMSEIR